MAPATICASAAEGRRPGSVPVPHRRPPDRSGRRIKRQDVLVELPGETLFDPSLELFATGLFPCLPRASNEFSHGLCPQEKVARTPGPDSVEHGLGRLGLTASLTTFVSRRKAIRRNRQIGPWSGRARSRGHHRSEAKHEGKRQARRLSSPVEWSALLLRGPAGEFGFLTAGTQGAGDCLDEGCVLHRHRDFDAPGTASGDPLAVTGYAGRLLRLRS